MQIDSNGSLIQCETQKQSPSLSQKLLIFLRNLPKLIDYTESRMTLFKKLYRYTTQWLILNKLYRHTTEWLYWKSCIVHKLYRPQWTLELSTNAKIYSVLTWNTNMLEKYSIGLKNRMVKNRAYNIYFYCSGHSVGYSLQNMRTCNVRYYKTWNNVVYY